MNEEIIYPLGKDMENLKNKNYNMSALTIANTSGWVDKDNSHRVIARKEFEAQLKKQLHVTKYKCGVIVDTFIITGVMEEHEEELWLTEVKDNFLKLFIPTAKYCLVHLGDMEFKLYCILLNKYNMNQYYHLNENYFFSAKELLETMGYNGTDGTNVRHLGESLTVLKRLGLIDYNEEFVGRPGKHGLYRELYWAAQKSVYDIESSGIRDAINEGCQLGAADVNDAKMLGVTVPVQQLPQVF